MRLFTAILFNDVVKKELNDVKNKLKELSNKGTFTDIDNFHLTLLFLGEVDVQKVEEIKRAINMTRFSSFRFKFNKLGKFVRDDGDIYWVGIEHNNSLLSLQNKLSDNLSVLGFKQENFKPHITLGRRVILKNKMNVYVSIILPSNLYVDVNKISLMKSERVNGVLTYTEL